VPLHSLPRSRLAQPLPSSTATTTSTPTRCELSHAASPSPSNNATHTTPSKGVAANNVSRTSRGGSVGTRRFLTQSQRGTRKTMDDSPTLPSWSATGCTRALSISSSWSVTARYLGVRL
jgi:hypothetical protein